MFFVYFDNVACSCSQEKCCRLSNSVAVILCSMFKLNGVYFCARAREIWKATTQMCFVIGLVVLGVQRRGVLVVRERNEIHRSSSLDFLTLSRPP